jgi:hypothetical protein
MGELVIEPNAGGTKKAQDNRRPNRYTVTMPRGDRLSPHADPGVTPEVGRGDTQRDPGVTLLSHETSEGHVQTHPLLAPAAQAPEGGRAPDVIWDTLMEVTGTDASSIPKSSRGAYNRCVAELKAIGANPDDIRARAAAYRRRFPDAACTP